MKPTIAAARLGDRVILFTFRLGRIQHEFAVNLPWPRQIEDVVAAQNMVFTSFRYYRF